eukprot:282159-Rhodomonas_salina.1
MCTTAVKSYLSVPSDCCANLWSFVPHCSTKHAVIAEPTQPGRFGWFASDWVPGCAFGLPCFATGPPQTQTRAKLQCTREVIYGYGSATGKSRPGWVQPTIDVRYQHAKRDMSRYS